MSIATQVLLDGVLMPAAQAKVSALCEGFQFGRGAFETLRAQHGRAQLLSAHHDRLASACAALGLEPPPPAAELGERITRLLAAVRMRINSMELTSGTNGGLLTSTNSTIDDIARRMRSISFDLRKITRSS